MLFRYFSSARGDCKRPSFDQLHLHILEHQQYSNVCVQLIKTWPLTIAPCSSAICINKSGFLLTQKTASKNHFIEERFFYHNGKPLPRIQMRDPTDIEYFVWMRSYFTFHYLSWPSNKVFLITFYTIRKGKWYEGNGLKVKKNKKHTLTRKNTNLPYSIRVHILNEFLTAYRSCALKYFWKNCYRSAQLTFLRFFMHEVKKTFELWSLTL